MNLRRFNVSGEGNLTDSTRLYHSPCAVVVGGACESLLCLSLCVPAAVLVLAELHDVAGYVSQLQVGVAIVPEVLQ